MWNALCRLSDMLTGSQAVIRISLRRFDKTSNTASGEQSYESRVQRRCRLLPGKERFAGRAIRACNSWSSSSAQPDAGVWRASHYDLFIVERHISPALADMLTRLVQDNSIRQSHQEVSHTCFPAKKRARLRLSVTISLIPGPSNIIWDSSEPSQTETLITSKLAKHPKRQRLAVHYIYNGVVIVESDNRFLTLGLPAQKMELSAQVKAPLISLSGFS